MQTIMQTATQFLRSAARFLAHVALFIFSLVAAAAVAQTFIGVGVTSMRLNAQGGSGDVVGPASSTNGQMPVYSGTTGKLLGLFTGTGLFRFVAGIPTLITPGTAGNCVVWSATTIFGDSGAPCGGGGGGGGSYAAGTGINPTSLAAGTVELDATTDEIVAAGSQSITLPTVTTGTCQGTLVTASGAVLGGEVAIIRPVTLAEDAVTYSWVTATNQIHIRVCKFTTGSATVDGLTFGWKVRVQR